MFKLDLLDGENLISVYRQTEAVLLKPLLVIFILIYFPDFFLLQYGFVRFIIFWTVLVFLYGINKYILWLLNVNVLTNKRLIQVGYKNFFNKKVLESPLERILNISFSVKGFWQALFQFGTVEVQVAGLREPMLLKNLSHPSQVKDFLWKIHNQNSEGAHKLVNSEIAHEIIIHKPEALN